MTSALNRFILCCWLMLIVLRPLATGQFANQPSPADERTADEKLQSLILKVRGSNYDPFIGQSVIPELKQGFINTSDRLTRENVASVLMRLGQRDDAYWSVLYKRAQEIVDSHVPYPLAFDETGKTIRGVLSPNFLQWAEDHGQSKDEIGEEQLYVFPGEILLMADVGDPRGLSILRKGLSSPNYSVRIIAARGLALLQDKNSISSIIEAAETAPKEAQPLIASSLVAFDDSRARAAAEELVSDKKLLESVKQSVQAKGARGLQ